MEKGEVTPVLFYGGAKGGGKSYLVRAREVYRRLKYPGTKGIIIRKTYPELLSNHIRKFFEEYPDVRQWFRYGESAIHWPNGSLTEFSHLQSANDVYAYQGREYDDITLDEITQHEEEVFKILRSSNRTTNPTIKPSMFLTGNPGGVGHAWVKRLFVDRQFLPYEEPSDYGFIQAKVYDNHALMDADPAYIKRLESLPEDKRRAYLDGDWDIFSGQVFSEFRRDLHTCEQFKPKKEFSFVAGMDWGRAAPFAFYLSLIRELKHDGEVFFRVYTFYEAYGTEKSPKEWATIIKNALRDYGVSIDQIRSITGDASMFNRSNDMSLSIADQFKREGMYMRPASRDRLGRVEATHNWLSMAPDGEPYWIITKNCENLIRTLPLLIYDEHKAEDVDTTQEDHAYDAVTYCLKDLKWVGAKSGAITNRAKNIMIPKYQIVNEKGQYISLDPEKFGEKPGKPYYK